MKVGDPVTVVGVRLHHVHITELDQVQHAYAGTALHKFICYLDRDAEGAGWIFGHHTAESPDGQALLAAAGLRK